MEAKLEARTTQQRDADEFFAAWLDEDGRAHSCARRCEARRRARGTDRADSVGDAAGQPVVREAARAREGGAASARRRGGGDDAPTPCATPSRIPTRSAPEAGTGGVRGGRESGTADGRRRTTSARKTAWVTWSPSNSNSNSNSAGGAEGGDPAERDEDPAEKKEPTEAQKRWWVEHHGGVDTRVAPEDTRVAPEDTRVAPEDTREPSSAAAPVPEEETPGARPDAVDPVTMKRLEEAATACSAAFPKKGKANFPAIIKSHLLEMHRELTAGAAGGAASTMPSGDSASEASTIPSGAADSDGEATEARRRACPRRSGPSRLRTRRLPRRWRRNRPRTASAPRPSRGAGAAAAGSLGELPRSAAAGSARGDDSQRRRLAKPRRRPLKPRRRLAKPRRRLPKPRRPVPTTTCRACARSSRLSSRLSSRSS